MLCSRSRLANDLCTGRHDAHGLAPGVYGLFDHRKLRMLSLKPRVSLTIVDKEMVAPVSDHQLSKVS